LAVRLEFYIDPETGEPHISLHNVKEEEVAEVLVGDGLRWRASDGKTVVIGKTGDGRFLQTVIVEGNDPDDPILVITAYPPNKELIAAYRRRMRKKGKR
jgi:hypothetical protein